jgi:hypothetical protein
MDTKGMFYVLTEEEMHNLLREQRKLCAEFHKQYTHGIISAPEPPLPPLLSEWKIVNKITHA